MSSINKQMTIVIVGHVDHGKSTVIGRLLADTKSLPEGKLEAVKENCRKNSKPFEYAFLLDALKDEQAQGITIDSARCFFKTQKRNYIIFDAPGHIEFLKNMVTGAAHAEAALLVIDANEGIQENSKRHGYLLSMLGISQVTVLVNKMDLVDYKEEVFSSIVDEYTKFLNGIGVQPTSFIPISAREGDNIAGASQATAWYKGKAVLEQLDSFENKASVDNLPFRFPVQDVYKFTEDGDDRRIVAGTVESGSINVGDEVQFLPSFKSSVITSVEEFNRPAAKSAKAGQAIGFTLGTQIYITPGELMVKKDDVQPKVASTFRANIFWMSRAPLIKNKRYKLKLASSRVGVYLREITKVIDAAELDASANKTQIDRHDVAEIVLETEKPLAFDLVHEIETLGRFVLVDNYEIAGGGIILAEKTEAESLLDKHIKEREKIWQYGQVSYEQRAIRYRHHGKTVLFCGQNGVGKIALARELESYLFRKGHNAYYLGLSNVIAGLEADGIANRQEHIRRLGELSRILTEAGQIFITTISDIDDYDLDKIKRLNEPHEIIIVNVGENQFNRFETDLDLEANSDIDIALGKVYNLLREKDIVVNDYVI